MPAPPLPGGLARVLSGRLSLQFVVLVSVGLFWIVGLLAFYILAFRLYHALRLHWRERRMAFFEPGVEKALLEEPAEAVAQAFRPRLPGDADIAQDVMIEAMRHLLGPPFEALRDAARRLGFVELNLRRLGSRRRYKRGRAMEALGVMRVREARGPLIAAAHRETIDMKLVALRSLALIREPEDLAHFIEVAGTLSPAMLVRLASLMMEFGPLARPYVAKLVSLHPQAFTPRVMKLMLAEAAVVEEPGS